MQSQKARGLTGEQLDSVISAVYGKVTHYCTSIHARCRLTRVYIGILVLQIVSPDSKRERDRGGHALCLER